MSYLIIRDDDISYWTKPEEIEHIYKHLFNRKIKVSFAVIPFSVKSYNLGNINSFYQETIEKPIYENKALVDYLKEKIKDGLVEIMLHGYNHLYCIKCDREILIATQRNLDLCKKQHLKFEFIGEYNCHDYETLLKRTRIGKECLEDTFGIFVKNFVPPSNQINKFGIKAIVVNKLNLSGIIGKIYNRELTLRGLITYTDRLFFSLRNRGLIYPKIADYGYHKELVGYSLTPSTNWDFYFKQLNFCLRKKYPFQIATHYWELKGELKEYFYMIINYILKKGFKSALLKEVLT